VLCSIGIPWGVAQAFLKRAKKTKPLTFKYPLLSLLKDIYLSLDFNKLILFDN
jgi:hypothetical protein